MVIRFSDTQLDLLYKLWRHKCFGKGHMLIDNLASGFPTHLLGEIRMDIDELVKENILVQKPTRHGAAVFINLGYRDPIEKTLKKKYQFF